MRRVEIAPRPDWVSRVEEVGLIYHHTSDGPYWDESAVWEFSLREIEDIERATRDLHRLALAAAQKVIDDRRYADFGIPAWVVPLIEMSWYLEPPSLYGRMDLAYDGSGPVKLLEYNADTPTSLVESAVAQWYWLQDVSPSADQFNAIHEALVEKWQDVAAWAPIHFAHVNQSECEDLMTVTYLRETAQQAGLETFGLSVEDIGWDGDQFVDIDGRPITTLFKLYPWEWLIHEPFAKFIPETTQAWIEPIWKMLLSNKAILAVLWEMNPGHPHLLPAYLDGPRDLLRYVRKPRLSREGANVTIVDGVFTESRDGDYGAEGYVWQALASLPRTHAVIGSWMIDQTPCGIGVREPKAGTRITSNLSRFVPHRID